MPNELAVLLTAGLLLLLAQRLARARALYLRPTTAAARSRRQRR